MGLGLGDGEVGHWKSREVKEWRLGEREGGGKGLGGRDVRDGVRQAKTRVRVSILQT